MELKRYAGDLSVNHSRFVKSVILLLFSSAILPALANTAAAMSTSTRSALAQISQSFSQGKPVNSVTLNATAEWIAGSDDETGSAVLTSAADGSFSVQLQLPKSSRTESRTSFTSGQTCSWSGSDGVSRVVSHHNCMGPMAWFMPSVALLGNQLPSDVVTTIVGDPKGTYVDIQQQRTPPGGATADTARLMTHLSTSDLYLDPTTYLPDSLTFSIHPDDNGGSDIPVKIVFTNYQSVQGAMVPFRIQRYVNGTLNLDLTVNQASVN